MLRDELALADSDLDATSSGSAIDRYVRALGLAVQLGPAATELVLNRLLLAASELFRLGDAVGLSTLGPAIVRLVDCVREAGALPADAVMEAWSAIAEDVGAIIGQIGLALSMPPDHRMGMIEGSRARAALLDQATDSVLGLSAWLNGICPVP